MICGAPMGTPFWPTFCLIPRNRPHSFHMDASVICLWCCSNVDPTAWGDDAPALTSGGVVFHRRCVVALRGERTGRAAA